MSDRLQEVKERAATEKQHDFFTELPYEDFEWLIKQAEIVKDIKLEINNRWSTEKVSVSRLHQLIDRHK